MTKFNEEEHPRNSEGEFISKDLQDMSAEQLKQQILSEQGKKEHNAENYSEELKTLLGTEYKGFKGQAAVDKLMQEKQGYVKGAFHRDDVGDIDLFWGDENVGLRHIIKQREKEKEGHAQEVLSKLEISIEKGVIERKNDKGNFELIYKEGNLKYFVIIAPEYHDNKITYVISAFRRGKKQ